MASKPQLDRGAITDAWIRGSHDRETLRAALIEGGAAGVNSHDRPNVLWKIKRLVEGDPVSQFGLTGVSGLPFEDVLRLVADHPLQQPVGVELGVLDQPDPLALERIGPRHVLDGLRRHLDRGVEDLHWAHRGVLIALVTTSERRRVPHPGTYAENAPARPPVSPKPRQSSAVRWGSSCCRGAMSSCTAGTPSPTA